MSLATATDRRQLQSARTTSSSSAPAAPGCARRSRRKQAGADVGLVCKSLLGKAHTVMAEGGVAAALGPRRRRPTRGRCTSATRWSAASC